MKDYNESQRFFNTFWQFFRGKIIPDYQNVPLVLVDVDIINFHINRHGVIVFPQPSGYTTLISTFRSLLVVVLFFVEAYSQDIQKAPEKIWIRGAGPSIESCERFCTFLNNHQSEFLEEGEPRYIFLNEGKSIKHAGGLKHAEKFILGRTGRPLNASEKKNFEEILAFDLEICFATSSFTGISELPLDSLRSIVTKTSLSWKGVAGKDVPTLVIGRERTEAALSQLRQDYPFFESLLADTIVRMDHQVLAILQKPYLMKKARLLPTEDAIISFLGSLPIGFGTAANFANKEGVTILKTEGLQSTLKCGLVYHKKNAHSPAVQLVKKAAASELWKQLKTRK